MTAATAKFTDPAHKPTPGLLNTATGVVVITVGPVPTATPPPPHPLTPFLPLPCPSPTSPDTRLHYLIGRPDQWSSSLENTFCGLVTSGNDSCCLPGAGRAWNLARPPRAAAAVVLSLVRTTVTPFKVRRVKARVYT